MEVLNNTVIKILQIVKNWAIPMYEICGNNKNQMVNQKQLKEKKRKVGMQFQPRRRVEVGNNKKEGLTMLIVESNEWSNLESTEGIAERQRERRALLMQLSCRAPWVTDGSGPTQYLCPNQSVSAHKAPNSVTPTNLF